MKQIVFIASNVENMAAKAAKISLQGLHGRCRSTPNNLSMNSDTQIWLESDCEVEVRVVEDLAVLESFYTKSSNSNLCPVVMKDSGSMIVALAVGPFPDGVIKSVFGDVNKYLDI